MTKDLATALLRIEIEISTNINLCN
jgi:hypothetical protein